MPRPDPKRFILEKLALVPVPDVPAIRLYTAHSGSGLWKLLDDDAPAPYWAYQWGGGLVLARHLAEHPELVRDRRVLDLGSGSGLVAIAAAKAGAAPVMAAEIDANALVALALNAEANDVALDIVSEDLTAGEAPAVDVILVGDLFYAPDLAERVTAFLRRCTAAGIEVIVGDPGRAFLPHAHLQVIAEYGVADFGSKDAGERLSRVFAFRV